jgi:uncharacterized membrane protein YcaP (DUF421 family)
MTLSLDWSLIFSPSVPVLELIIRGTIMYLVLFVMLRLTFKRTSGVIGLSEILMIALIAAATQNSIARENRSIADGIILVATIAFWGYTLDWLAHHSATFERFYHPPPLLLVKNGRLQRHNMKIELITETELMAYLHRDGIDDVTEVAEAYIQADGTITIIRQETHSSE